MPGCVENVCRMAFGGLVRTLAPFCEKTDWKMRPSVRPYPPRNDAVPEADPVSHFRKPSVVGSAQAPPIRGSMLLESAG